MKQDFYAKSNESKFWFLLHQLIDNTLQTWKALSPFQAFSQRGIRVTFGHPIADFGHPNPYFFVYNAMRWKGIGHPILPKCVFLDTQFWNPG